MAKRYLVPKVPHAGENHRYAMLVGGGDDFVVLDRAARLNDRLGAGIGLIGRKSTPPPVF